MKRKNKRNKEEIAEDYCFVCKDGGLLLVCDYKDCLKAYHPQCVGKDDSFLENKNRWTCEWHSCLICHKAPKFYCFCCPNAVCGRCISAAEFVIVRGNKGFCNHCLKLILLIEENMDVDSDGGKVDFKDRETYEFLFMEYWEIIKEKEGLTAENIQFAKTLLKKGKNYKLEFDLDEISKDEDENQLIISEYDTDDTEEHKPVRKRKRSKGKLHVRSKGKLCVIKRKVKSKKKEFIGWGSKSLIEFLESIGKDTTKQLSQYEVTSIFTGYIHENKLFLPDKKKKVICDERLQSVLRRKSVNIHKIYDLLEVHFAENLEQSEEEDEDEVGYSSGDKVENIFVACKKQRKSSVDRRSHNKEVVVDVQESCFAAIVAKNIKLVYLRRTLVEELLKTVETFESKIMGGFVRVKSDPNDYLQKHSHQLLQVTGIKKTSCGINTEILLQVSNRPTDVPISMLSDDDFSEEECEDLRRKVKDGLLRQPTVVELEQKARNLHEDITQHWIGRELALLQNLIDRANEKGWRRDLFEYMERRQLLQTPSEQSRLLQEVPKVIADITELETTSEDSLENDKQGHNGSTKLIPEGTSEIPSNNLEGNGDVIGEDSTFAITKSGSAGNGVGVGVGEAINGNTAKKSSEGLEEKQTHSEASVSEELPQQCHVLAAEVQNDGVLRREAFKSIPEEKQHCPEASLSKKLPALSIPEGKHPCSEASLPEKLPPQSYDDSLQTELHQSIPEESLLFPEGSFVEELPQQSYILAPEPQSDVTFPREPHRSSSHNAAKKKNRAIDVEQMSVKDRRALAVQVIELSDDDEQTPVVAIGKQTLEDQESSIWHYVGPRGETKGPYSMSLLKRWSNSSSYALKCKVWKIGQSQEQAILMGDALHQIFPRK